MSQCCSSCASSCDFLQLLARMMLACSAQSSLATPQATGPAPCGAPHSPRAARCSRRRPHDTQSPTPSRWRCADWPRCRPARAPECTGWALLPACHRASLGPQTPKTASFVAALLAPSASTVSGVQRPLLRPLALLSSCPRPPRRCIVLPQHRWSLLVSDPPPPPRAGARPQARRRVPLPPPAPWVSPATASPLLPLHPE
mmetsp:Transcript_36584/g.85129  ORF Transcript_36584/g.85129 Transcript_36584/m.85129 type:complete len:200 (+) Transcript_36584:395-994(+)